MKISFYLFLIGSMSMALPEAASAGIGFPEPHMAFETVQNKNRHDVDIFAMWEQGISAEAIYGEVAADGEFSLAEVLAAADVVLEIKDLIAKEKADKNDIRKIQVLQGQLKQFDALYRRILKASKGRNKL